MLEASLHMLEPSLRPEEMVNRLASGKVHTIIDGSVEEGGFGKR